MGSGCQTKDDGLCMPREKMTAKGRYFASWLGTLPSVLIITLSSEGFQTINETLKAGIIIVAIVYIALLGIWVGLTWLVGSRSLANYTSYASVTAGSMSSVFGFSVSLFPLLTEG